MDKLKEIYLTDTGRLNRLKFFKYAVILGIVEIIALTIIIAMFSDEYGFPTETGNTFSDLLLLASIVPYYFITVKRVHDFSKDSVLAKVLMALCAYMILIADDIYFLWGPLDYLVSLANTALTLYVVFKSGTKGENQYGPDPLQ